MRGVNAELFDELPPREGSRELADGAWLLHGFALDAADTLLAGIETVVSTAPFRHLVTPGGRRMSVAMSNCGELGWHSDKRGYRYVDRDPLTGKPWPDMPPALRQLAQQAAERTGYPNFNPDVCLINRYEPGTRLTLHQDRDEGQFDAPIVSVSLGRSGAIPFWRSHAQRSLPAHPRGPWRCGGVGRPVAHGLSRHRAAGRKPPSGHRQAALQPHLPQRTLKAHHDGAQFVGCC